MGIEVVLGMHMLHEVHRVQIHNTDSLVAENSKKLVAVAAVHCCYGFEDANVDVGEGTSEMRMGCIPLDLHTLQACSRLVGRFEVFAQQQHKQPYRKHFHILLIRDRL